MKDDFHFFDDTDISDMIRMYTEDSTVRGASNLRFQQLCLPQLQAEYDNRPMGKLMSHVFTQYWVTFVRDMYHWFTLFDHCCYVIHTEKIKMLGDELRMDKYGELVEGEDYVRVKVPIAQPFESERNVAMRFRRHRVECHYMHDDGLTIDRSVKVVMRAPPTWGTYRHASDIALLLRDWRELQEEKLLSRQVAFTLAVPPIFLEHQQISDVQQMTELSAEHTTQRSEGMFRRNPDGYLITLDKGRAIQLTSNSTNTQLRSKLFENKECIDRQDNFIPLPSGFKMTNAVAQPAYSGDILQRTEHFKEQVALTLTIPFYLIKPTYGDKTLGNSSGGMQHQNVMLKESTHVVSQRLMQGMKEVWLLVYPDDDPSKLVLHLPVVSTTDLASALEMFERGVLPENLAREEALRAHNIDPKRVEKTTLPKMRRLNDGKGKRTT